MRVLRPSDLSLLSPPRLSKKSSFTYFVWPEFSSASCPISSLFLNILRPALKSNSPLGVSATTSSPIFFSLSLDRYAPVPAAPRGSCGASLRGCCCLGACAIAPAGGCGGLGLGFLCWGAGAGAEGAGVGLGWGVGLARGCGATLATGAGAGAGAAAGVGSCTIKSLISWPGKVTKGMMVEFAGMILAGSVTLSSVPRHCTGARDDSVQHGRSIKI
ncbi:hypothetical protein B484DRAFT_46963 [Ochromonadaceae sp. CCMP2298]|nr:hypothetical protein B484DRAFT_46963 [Ochromonadaceae sp. CCMP2298]